MKVGIVGASGYAGETLVKLLLALCLPTKGKVSRFGCIGPLVLKRWPISAKSGISLVNGLI